MTHGDSPQSQFQGALIQDNPPPPGLLALRSEAQFGVYRNAYRARLRGALRDNYEVLPLVMGDEAFDALANAYIQANPSTHYSLRWFGHHLGAFMAAHDALVQHPAMVDLAHMEWALRNAFDAAQSPVLAPADLATLPAQHWPDLRLTLHPSVQLLDLQWAVGPIWHALKAGQEEVPAPDALAHHMLVWRERMQTQWKSLSQAQAVFVQGLQAGHSFGQLCEDLAALLGEEHAAQAAATVLHELLDVGAIRGLPSGATETLTGSLQLKSQ